MVTVSHEGRAEGNINAHSSRFWGTLTDQSPFRETVKGGQKGEVPLVEDSQVVKGKEQKKGPGGEPKRLLLEVEMEEVSESKS